MTKSPPVIELSWRDENYGIKSHWGLLFVEAVAELRG